MLPNPLLTTAVLFSGAPIGIWNEKARAEVHQSEAYRDVD
jgi:hypothetical protein